MECDHCISCFPCAGCAICIDRDLEECSHCRQCESCLHCAPCAHCAALQEYQSPPPPGSSPNNGQWSEWTAWGSCSQPCGLSGSSARSRTRTCHNENWGQMGSRRLRDFFGSLSSEFENGTMIDHFALPQFSEEGFLQDVLEFGSREFPHVLDFGIQKFQNF